MTSVLDQPLANRKDIDTLKYNQTDTPCLQGVCGQGDKLDVRQDPVWAFLMRLYAYFFAKYSGEMISDYVPEGTERLKARLMSTGPYQVYLVITDYDARPNAVRVKSVPRDASAFGWWVLWPGAAREIYVETGRLAPAFHKPVANIRANMEPATLKVLEILFAEIENSCAWFTVPRIPRPIYLIPP